ncbi:MAG: hypothetical protein IPM57_01055 [Oligoflexia bacterium]|nr:hypothetical protein [Oligoflexia bacterium]
MFLLLFSFLAYSSVPVLQGVTTENSTQINFLVEKGRDVVVLAEDIKSKKAIEPKLKYEVLRDYSDFKIIKVRFDSLKANTKYKLEIKNKDNTVLDERFFKTLNKSSSNPVIAITSCMDDSYEKEQKEQWQDLVSFKPDLILLIGDNVYVDKPINNISADDFWKRYVQVRQKLEIFRIKNLIPIVAVWDDHDYGKNNGDSSFKYKDEAKSVFDSFYSQEDEKPFFENSFGVSSRLSIYGFNIFLLDNRSLNTKESIFGKDQKNWLFSALQMYQKPSFIINGMQFFGAYHEFESYERLTPDDFIDFRSQLKKVKTPFILISGDRHLTELMKLSKQDVGQDSFEFTTSAIHAKTYPSPWEKTPNPRIIHGEGGSLNYGILKIKKLKPFTIVLQAIGPKQKILYQKRLVIN